MESRADAPAASGVAFWTVAFAAVSAATFGWVAPAFETRHGVPLIDAEAAPSAERMVQLVAAYGEAGRRAYLSFLSLDCVFPVVASLFVIAAYRPLLRRAGVAPGVTRVVVGIPAAAAVLDLVENTFEALLALLYPRGAHVLAELARVSSLLKLVLVAAAAVLFVLLVAVSVRRRITAK